MQAMRTVLPKFNAQGRNAAARPMRWPRNMIVAILGTHGVKRRVQRRAVWQVLRLLGSPRPKPTFGPTRLEVRIGLRVTHGLYRALHANLAMQAFPMKAQSGPRILIEFRGLLALQIRIKHKAMRIMAFQQNHARIGHAIAIDGS